MAQFNRSKPLGTTVYQLCIYLNYLDLHGLEAVDATMDIIYNFLCELYVDGLSYAGDGTPKSYSTICDYVETLSKLYDALSLRGYQLDESLYTRSQKMMLLPESSTKYRKGHVIKKYEHLTMVHYLSKMFSPNQNDIPEFTYTKWYSAEQIRAISDELPLTYRCIFLDTVYTGHRIDSALSLTLDTVDLYNAQVTPTRTKTGKKHTSLIPPNLVEDFQSYIMEVRNSIDTDSEYFFVGRNGTPVTYGAYRSALESARIKVNKKYSWNIKALHTHAGRSTFAAAIRSYQLEQQRKGIPTFSDKGPHLVTTSEFNSFLSEFCAQHQIVDAAGNPAKITSHDLRHIDVCERFKSNIVSTERTSVECNHACVEDTMGYGYYSKHDEATHLAEIVKPILPFDFDTAPSPRKVPPRKYETLAKQPATRVIPYYGLCLNRKCSPQFEKCFHCGSFIPDPQYKKYIKANIERLQKVNDQILKKHGNPTVLQQNLKDIQTFNIYLEKMDVTEEHQKRSRVV